MACIYIIRHNESDNSYIGSTKDFNDRKTDHKNDCYNVNHRNHNYRVYQFVRDNGGWNNFTMEKLYDVKDDENRFEKEQEYMDMYKPSLNQKRAFGMDMEVRKMNKKKNDRDYFLNNREKINEHHRDYRREIIICDCGKEVTRYARNWARTTGRHNHKN